MFVGFELPESALDAIDVSMVSLVKKIPLDARITKRENMHITISFLGNQDEKMIPRILGAIRGVVVPESFYISTQAIDYGPPSYEKSMVWLSIAKETSKELEFMKLSLEANLYRNGIVWERENHSGFNGHVTIARFNAKTRDRLNPIFTQLSLSFHPNELTLYESELTPFGPNYTKISG